MTRIAPTWIAIVLAGILHLATAQSPAHVPITEVGATLGGPTNFSCQSHGLPISTCLWERDAPAGSSAGVILLNFNPSNARPGDSPKPGYSYLGDGLEKGECGLLINTVKEEDNGKWKCTLITSQALYRGQVELGILRKPEPPKFNPNSLNDLVDSDESPYRDQKPTRIVCFSASGQPPPRFLWYIDDEPLTEGLSPINTTVNQGISYTYQELVNHRFSWRENGKKLRCVMQHDALTAADAKEAVMDIDVSFAPRSTRDEGRSVSVRAEVGTEKVLSVNVSANPKPHEVIWTVDGKPLRDGETTDKYEAIKLQEVTPGVFQASLKIKSVAEEDVNKHFILKLRNNFGETEYDLRVASESTGSGGLSAAGIVFLILGIAALLIIIALVVVYARAQGLLCFKGDDGTASEKERMDGGSTGVGAGDEQQGQQQKPGLKLTSRLTALYDNLLNKKKDKPVPSDEESATKEKEPVQQSSSPSKPPGTPANPPPNDSEPEKKNDDIVYAELDLARSGLATGGNGPNPEIVVRADDKTEYAEIVGVVSANSVEEAKRSPSASAKSGGSTDK